MKSIWRQNPSGRLRATNFIKKIYNDVLPEMTDDFFETTPIVPTPTPTGEPGNSTQPGMASFSTAY